ncbi:methyltransferase [Devosia sp. MC532]|uniref:class I SAM-dependent RNA methyltransferase n=1 Tax=Devosia sp. MC532 TaxID=2799788 RepID=UPI0020C0A51D|nr:methyltransferase [Devosia sp. MC532]
MSNRRASGYLVPQPDPIQELSSPMSTTVTIETLGQRGEGVTSIDGQRVYVPFTLPGEEVVIEHEGERGQLQTVTTASADRIEPFCPYFGECGGCQIQHLSPDAYKAFKIGLVETALQHAGLEHKVEAFHIAHGEGRRRATLHARKDAAGYMRIRSHELLNIEKCPILVPALVHAPKIARILAASIGECDVSFTATTTGLDVHVRKAPKGLKLETLVPLAAQLRLARLSIDGDMVSVRQQPTITMGRSEVDLPIGSFLQATAQAEDVLASYVIAAVGKSKSVADLFCGIGPFALRLAEKAPVYAADSDKAATLALAKATRFTKGLKAVTSKVRDLFRDPLTQFELNFETVVLDPPRAGAEAQIRELVKSKVKNVVMVACDPKTFARDAKTLVQAGFILSDLIAVDQFAWSTHIEVAGTFRR